MKKLLVALLMLPALARAEFWTGNNLYNKLSSNDTIDRIQAIGYVMGVFDVYVNVTFCPADQSSITAGQVRDMALAWLAANPATRNKTAESLINDAFKQAWPCRNRGGTRL
jgi:hypothetical protein